MERLLSKTKDVYPTVALAIVRWIKNALHTEEGGFARASITSPAKIAMVKDFEKIVETFFVEERKVG
jgi:hypothetical protein